METENQSKLAGQHKQPTDSQESVNTDTFPNVMTQEKLIAGLVQTESKEANDSFEDMMEIYKENIGEELGSGDDKTEQTLEPSIKLRLLAEAARKINTPFASKLAVSITSFTDVRHAIQFALQNWPRSGPLSAAEFFSGPRAAANHVGLGDAFRSYIAGTNTSGSAMTNPQSSFAGCSLIYSYWLDELGLHIALERIADRLCNGVRKETKSLESLHIKQDSPIADAIDLYAEAWQRGSIPDLNSRRRQYFSLYGYPLYAATAYGQMDTIDPRHSFPAAFNGFLHQTMGYYEEKRDLQMTPDISDPQREFARLAEMLSQGNENMRLRKPPRIRGFTEYSKRLLGGSISGGLLATEWDSYLRGRPGMKRKPWQVRVESVHGSYGWEQPSISDYTALAENGEMILILVRLADVLDLVSDQAIFRAFLDLLENAITAYVNSYRAVARVDLQESAPGTPPAAAMSRHIKPPPIAPLRKEFAVRAPMRAA